MTLRLTSSAFEHEGMIPRKYTRFGEDVSPPLQWNDPPEGTKSFALICDDPDAPRATPWVHWVIFNIPAQTRQLPEGVPTDKDLPDGSRQGKNDYGDIGYGGPQPPSGTHRYFFRLYALDTTLDLPAGTTTKDQLLKAMVGHVLARGELMGKYSR